MTTPLQRTTLRKKQFAKRIIGIEIVGFLSAILIVWIDEILDIPHIIFGALDTPINYLESIFESALIALLAIVIISLTHTILKRLRYLEGILPVCSFCNKIRSKERWVPIEDYISEHSAAAFSHGVCPECAAANYGDILKSKGKNGQ